MIDKRESDFIFIRWLLFIVALTIFLIIFYKFGFINDLIENDVSFISPIIIIIFILFTGHVGYILYKLRKTHQACLIFKDECISTEKFNKSQLVSFNSTNNPFLTIIYNHFKNLNTFMNNESPSESSKKELIKRLKNRAQDSTNTVNKRLSSFNSELSHWKEYEYVLINDNLQLATKQISLIIKEKKRKVLSKNDLIKFITSLKKN